MYGYNVTSLFTVCMRACCVLDKCSHCTLFTFRWFQCLSAFMSTLHIPGRTPSPSPTLPPYPHNTHLFYRSHYARYHIPFFHNNGLEWSLLSSINRGESRQGVTHISVIYIDKVNGMECVCTCVCADSTSILIPIPTWFRTTLPTILPCRNLHFWRAKSHANTPGSCIQRVALKGSPPKNVPIHVQRRVRVRVRVRFRVELFSCNFYGL